MAAIALVYRPQSLAARLMWASLAEILLFGVWFEFGERHRLFMTLFLLLLATGFLVEEQAARPAL